MWMGAGKGSPLSCPFPAKTSAQQLGGAGEDFWEVRPLPQSPGFPKGLQLQLPRPSGEIRSPRTHLGQHFWGAPHLGHPAGQIPATAASSEHGNQPRRAGNSAPKAGNIHPGAPAPSSCPRAFSEGSRQRSEPRSLLLSRQAQPRQQPDHQGSVSKEIFTHSDGEEKKKNQKKTPTHFVRAEGSDSAGASCLLSTAS